MDIQGVLSDLRALIELYDLLRNDADGLQAGSCNLHEKAQLLLKNLLDGAKERIFKAYSKIMVAHLGTAPYPTQLEPLKGTLKLDYPVSADLSRMTPDVAENYTVDPSCHKVAPRNGEQAPTELPTESGIIEQLKLKIDASKPENRKKRCRVCQQSNLRQQSSPEEKSPSSEKSRNPKKDDSTGHQQHNQPLHFRQSSGLIEGLQLDNKAVKSKSSIQNQRQKQILECNLNDGGFLTLLSTPTSGVAKPGPLYNFTRMIEQEPVKSIPKSKEVADTIKQIESCISKLQLVAEHERPLHESRGPCSIMAGPIMGAISVTPIVQATEGSVARREISQMGESFLGINDSVHQTCQFALGTDDSRSQMVNQKIQGSSQMPQTRSQTLSKLNPTKLPNKTKNQSSRLLPNQGLGSSSGVHLVDGTASELGKPIERHKFLGQRAIQFAGPIVKPMVEEVKPISQLSCQKDLKPSPIHKLVKGFRVPPPRNEIANWASSTPTKMSSHSIVKENLDQNRMAQLSQQSVPSQSVRSKVMVRPARKLQAIVTGHRLRQAQTRETTPRKVLQLKRTTRPALLNQKLSQTTVSQSLHEDSESGWTNQQASTTGSSPSSRTRIQNYADDTSSNEGEMYTLSSGSLHQQMGPVSSSEIDAYSMSSRSWTHNAPPLCSTDSDSHDWATPRHRMDPMSRRIGLLKNYRSGSWLKPEKPVGRLRKLKDKLAIIFHHHHHHHHHHHNGSDCQSKGRHAFSLWKYAGRMFHSAGKDEAKVEKLNQSVVCKGAERKQRRHFQALVQSMLSHVGHRKASKTSKAQHCDRKVGKKSHWWQMFRRHRGVKLPNKARIKLGNGSKKQQLRKLQKMG